MSKVSIAAPAEPSVAASASSSAPAAAQKHPETWRDTFEQIVLAFVLALVFRTFEAEAFVIPTGSMAPTLWGRNKEMACTQCGFDLVVGASSEVTRDGSRLKSGTRIEGAICPNCRYLNTEMEQARVFNGDRILVNKFPYELGEPHRWDVFVFKYPEKPGTNYIKRLVGLPGETIRIQGGDLYRLDENGSTTILRKAPDKQKVLQIPVYNHDFASETLDKIGWPQRWQSLSRPADARAWTTGDGWRHNPEDRSFSLAADAAGTQQWLRYQHLTPTTADWRKAVEGQIGDPRSRLIGDFCGYNAVWGREHRFHEVELEWSAADQVETGAFWTSDLTFSGHLHLEAPSQGAELTLELCDGPWWYRCRIDLTTGQARLLEVATHLSESDEHELATATTGVQGAGDWDLSFCNVDDRLCLWVDGTLVDFGDGALLSRTATSPDRIPQWSDLAPVGLAVTGTSATVSHLQLDRDIYYRAGGSQLDLRENRLAAAMDDPQVWYQEYRDARQVDAGIDHMDLPIGPDHFLALGDNSPRSSDSRFWNDSQRTVPRSHLVGKAFWIYWPHGVPFLNDGRGYGIVSHRLDQPRPDGSTKEADYPLYVAPFYPNFGRMHRIR
ncbi:MAG: signal peptidase I [Planctomycetaceae bacterium]